MECPICNKTLKSITYKHTIRHGLSYSEFKNMFPDLMLISEKELEAKKKSAAKSNEQRWSAHRLEYEKNPKKCLNCESPIPFSKNRLSFCDLSCSTSHNNKLLWKNIDESHPWKKRRAVWRSAGEKDLFEYIKNNHSGDWSHSKKFYIEDRQIVVDIFSKELNTIIEYDGRIHFVPYYGEKRLKEVQDRDLILKNYCLDNKIKLIRINEKTIKNHKGWKEKVEEALLSADNLHLLYLIEEI